MNSEDKSTLVSWENETRCSDVNYLLMTQWLVCKIFAHEHCNVLRSVASRRGRVSSCFVEIKLNLLWIIWRQRAAQLSLRTDADQQKICQNIFHGWWCELLLLWLLLFELLLVIMVIFNSGKNLLWHLLTAAAVNYILVHNVQYL